MVPASCLGQEDNKKQNPMTTLVEVGMCPGKQGQDGTKLSHSGFHEASCRQSTYISKDLSKADLLLINNSKQLLKFLPPTFLIFVIAT